MMARCSGAAHLFGQPRRKRSIGRMSAGAGGGFRETQWSLVLRARSAPSEASRKALAALCRDYRPPLLAFARRLEADPDRAEEMVQDFLARLVEKDVFGKADPARGRLRSFLRTALRRHMINIRESENTETAGGHVPIVEARDEKLASHEPSADQLLDRLWVRTLLDRALAQLASEHAGAGMHARFVALRDRMTGDDDQTGRDVGAQLGMSEGAVKLALHRLRKRFRALVRAEVAETVAHPEDIDAELADLLAALETTDEC
jgi:RNA polymerase sigma factor (sigma-70 family)